MTTGWTYSLRYLLKNSNGRSTQCSQWCGEKQVRISSCLSLCECSRRSGCEKLATVEENIVIAFTDSSGEDSNRITVLLNRSYKVPLIFGSWQTKPTFLTRKRDKEITKEAFRCSWTPTSGVGYPSMITGLGLTKFGTFSPFEQPVGLPCPQTYGCWHF